MTALRAVCFDLDGTLFDHRGAARTGVVAFIERLGLRPTDAAVDAWFAAEDEQYERWRSRQISFQEQRRARLRTVLPALGHPVPTSDDGLDALFDEYLQGYRTSWRLFPGTLSLLQDLRSRGFRLGLLTNGSEEQQRDKLARTGLDTAFDAVCISEAIGVQKPDARAFLTVARALDVDPAACLFVGDDVARDIVGARAAGMRALLVDHDVPGSADIRTVVLGAVDAAAMP
ncbi:HAD family hydrolase [Curtobacterium sp. VKM Ac-2922]|uniref:HAD family hydrolase n=1 Tax=Curtobacterium sp. VKM Ac-2922 TaxID=2929475 RepID=UPI001FB49DDE|nr:HAD family hydrolase [Curtobacterium sp. VKM Ac-2922]MCJ1713043.1 HAD family hydrolase [Curtobacterium sp. VKM Ac-2922]